MSNAFVGALDEARGDISLSKLASVMALRTGKKPNGLSGNLYRLVKGRQTPKEETINEIADALGALHELSDIETGAIRDRLLSAAHPSDYQAAERRRLWPVCDAILKKNKYDTSERQWILSQVGVSTMKLIIAADENGEEVKIVDPTSVSSDTRSHHGSRGVSVEKPNSTVLDAGRARIVVDGELTPKQQEALTRAAQMIEAILQV